MAVSVARAAVLTAIGCLIVAVAYVPPESEPNQRSLTGGEVVPEHARLNRLNRVYNKTVERLADVRFRDSLARVLSSRGANAASVEIAFRGDLPASARASFAATVNKIWREIEPLPIMRLLVILDVNSRPAATTYTVPRALDGKTCVASLGLAWNVQWLRRGARDASGTNLEPWVREMIAPCLYYGAFGQPGPHVETWLSQNWFRPANSADWTTPPPVVRVADVQAGYNFLLSSSFDALACTDGRVERCHEALADPPMLERTPRPRVRRSYWTQGFLADDHYLAALVHQMGRERFGQFWRSSAPLDSAFASAFGEPLEAWTAKWAHAFVPDLPPFGPAPRPRGASWAVLLAAIAVAASVVYVTRRQVR
jgi:hypothetical protein